MNQTLSFLFLSCFFLPCVHAEETLNATSLDGLHGAISKLVKRYYPESTSHVFERAIGFEFSTRVYVTDLVAKIPPGVPRPRGTERGPMANRVWCSIWLRDGALSSRPVYARSEGELVREHFIEHIFYPNDSEQELHMIVTLRLPLKTTSQQQRFLKEFKKMIGQFGQYLDRGK